ncbi:toxin YoeB [Mariniflexile fucanivorans]|uniref:Toxin YoeB n=1 Tax=Mariniflexile fucanivorans TaxID=264023 RepID=A0A4V2QEQ3_9FLAO|nr:type II toxin-antitoxin system RelE/ParE family toxin [Mariniflexile fucanivorans]TCL68887.1 toxin YoeB [Mariniflexile fucanivorans]
MVKEIVWSAKAQQDRKDIFEYWNHRNKSKLYSIKLNILFEASIKIILKYPEIGRPTSNKTIRLKTVKDYFIFYEISNEKLFILTIWDSRQNPKKLKL